MTTKILQPVVINNHKLANPLVFGPHRCNFPEGHLPGPKRIAYYQERAKNGVGMIIVEGSQVLDGEYPYDWALNVYEPKAVRAYAAMAAEIHRYPTVLVGQLNLYGGQGDSSVTRRPLWAPSPVAEVNSNEVPKIMDLADIALVEQGFVHGAKILAEAGLDGVEINAGQFSLLRQFLSGLTNFRGDDFGGSLENRCGLLLAILQKVRGVIGEEKILGLRLCGDEYAPWGGLQPDDSRQIAEYLADQVKIDYIAVENGSIYSVNMTMAGYGQPEDYAVAAAKNVGANLSLPICVGGSLVTVDSMTKALDDFALVDATRALIADPLLPKKVEAGDYPAITPCILCKQGCHTHSNTNPVVACSVNPLAGIEYRQKPLQPSAISKKIAVAGGGPAGIWGAITLAKLGHQVVLYEETGILGGHFAKFAKHFNSLKPKAYLDYLQGRLATYKVEVRLNTVLTLEETKKYQGVLVATGANYLPGAPPGQAAKISLDQLLATDFAQVKTETVRALVIDKLGDNKAIVACRRLQAKGYQVILITADSYFAQALVKLGEFSGWYGEMATTGIMGKTNVIVELADPDKLVLANKYSQKAEILPGVDLVVELAPPQVENTLWQQLQNQGIPCVLAGDAVAPRNLLAAIREGYLAGQEF